jgi:Tfp pilus assembly protein PilF
MQNPSDTLALTYYGFTHRKAGRVDLGMTYYQAALAADPDNFLARSYMGQGHAEAGEIVLAQAQLSEIRARGGRGTWAEWSLRQAIQTGSGYNY